MNQVGFLKRNYLLVLVILLAAFLRLFWLDRIPAAIGGDELIYVITAKSLFLTGSDLTGTWNPLSIIFFNYPPGEVQAELPYFLFAPAIGLFNLSLFWARLTNALLSVFLVFIIYLITKRFFSKNTAILASFIAAINPWFIYIGRTSYESTSATLFYLLSFYFLTSKNKKHILLSIPFLFLSFYAYIATKVFLLPFVFITIFYGYFVINKKKFKRQYLAVIIFSVSIVLLFLTVLKLNSSSSRIGEVLTPNNPLIAQEVQNVRKLSIQNPFLVVFENKYTTFLRIGITKLFNSFSFNYLFVNGDNFFSIWRNGLFYYLDALFLILGGLFIFAKGKKLFFFLFLLILVASLPQLVHQARTDNFTIHLSLIFPFMIIFIAVGIKEAVDSLKKKKYYLTLLTVILLYFLSLFNFLNIYFFQYPLKGYFDFPIRILSQYAYLNGQNGKQVLVYSPRSFDIFKKYLFYTNGLTKQTVPKVKEDVKKEYYKLGNVQFLACDSMINPPNKKEFVIIQDIECAPLAGNFKKIVIPRLDDGGETYAIYNDKICSKFTLSPYPYNLSVSDFDIENLSLQRFCQTYITKP